MLAKLAERAKAVAALVGSVVTALLASGVISDASVVKWLGVLAAMATAVVVYQVPNAPSV